MVGGLLRMRAAWMAVFLQVCILFTGSKAVAQEVAKDSYLITYRSQSSALRAAALSALSASSMVRVPGGSFAARQLGGASARLSKMASGSQISGSFYAAAQQRVNTDIRETEQYGRKHQDVCEQLIASNPEIESCSPDWILHTSAVPNDPRYQTLWGLKGTHGVRAPEAWEVTTGADDVVVAVIDTGVDYTHPDLAANMWRNPGEVAGNGIDDDANGIVDDVYGANFSGNGRGVGDPFDDNSHGTHVAGTIAGVGNNGTGVVGVAWRAKIMGLKFLNANGSGATSGAVEAINYLVAMKNRGINVKVVNNSWGGGGDSAALRDAIERANTAGILFTAAAGNSSQNIDERPQYPAAYTIPNILKVAAIDADGNLAYFSNYGARLVDIAAPGVDITSTIPGNRYTAYSGTSMATPHVSGVAALYVASHPSASLAEIKRALIESARPLSTLTGVIRSGRTLDAYRAVTDQTEPIAEPVSECPYAVREGQFVSDTAADGSTPVVRTDEDGFHTVALPFAFPFMGTYRSSLVLSPNGVAYFGGAPGGWDNRNDGTAPANSIAALHTDLYPDPMLGSGLGVRVARSSDRVTVAWKARLYERQTYGESVTARLTLLRSGLIRLSYEVTSQALENSLASATIGVRGGSALSSSTYSGRVRDGLRLELVPSCAPNTDTTHVESLVVSANSQLSSRGAARAGGRITIQGDVAGNGAVTLVGRVDGRVCSRRPTLEVSNGGVTRSLRLPSGLSGKNVSFSLVGGDGLSRSARLRIARPSTGLRARALMSRSQSCNAMMRAID